MSRAIDPAALAAFQAGLRRRFSDDQLLDELRRSAARLGRSPTMKEFAADPEAGVHPQTVIEHFGTWNAAKRAAGLLPRRFVTREELLAALRALGDELGHTPTVLEIKRRRGAMPSASLYWHTFGSLAAALREAGFDVTLAEERLELAITQGALLARAARTAAEVRRLARGARSRTTSLLTEWQVYRLFEARRGAWATFQYLVRERLVEEGATVAADGTVG